MGKQIHPRGLGYAPLEVDENREWSLSLDDADELLVFIPEGQSFSCVVPTNASVAFPIGTRVWIEKLFAGSLQIRGAPGVSLSRPLTQLTGTDQACLTKVDSDQWTLGGIGPTFAPWA